MDNINQKIPVTLSIYSSFNFRLKKVISAAVVIFCSGFRSHAPVTTMHR